jgi:superfamily I DNA/RNA helicase
MMNIEDRLTDAQIQLVRADAVSKVLVLAGPGTGKTHALISRLVHLIDVQGLSPFTEILVLSFSRAAVGEIHDRVEHLMDEGDKTGSLAYLNIRTFDSFATRLISAAEESVNLSGKSYDSRIAIATKVLEDPESESSRRLEMVKHVIVDEIQDLVSLRARMVQQILQRVGGGFTLLGDPAQAIYDYQVEKPADGPSAIEFLAWVRQTWSENLEVIELFKNHRARTASARVAEKIRPLVLQTQGGDPEGYRAIRALLTELPAAGKVNYLEPSFAENIARKRAILCRTNAEVLLTASNLIDQGIPVAFPPRLEERGLPPWMGRLFSNYLHPRISKDDFEQRWHQLVGAVADIDWSQAWGILKALEGSSRSDLLIEPLMQKLRSGVDWSFDSEIFQKKDNILVTTIHQSKGREFDDVIILPPEPRRVNQIRTALEEARVYYVAATRARDNIYRLNRDGLPAFERIRCSSGRYRFIGQMSGGSFWMEAGVPGDSLPFSTVNHDFLPDPALATQLQDVIWEMLEPGTRLSAVYQTRKGDPGFLMAAELSGTGKAIPVSAFDSGFTTDLTELLQQQGDGRLMYKEKYGFFLLLERYTGILPPFPEGVHEPFSQSGFYLGLNVRGMIKLL